MSIATQITRLQNLRNRLRTKILGLGLNQDPELDLDDCVGIVEGIGGTQNITTTNTYDVAGKQYAKVSDANLTPKNIVKNVSILGVVGTASVNPQPVSLEARTMLYGGANPPSVVYPSSGYDGLSSVTPELTDANPVLTAGNIKNGVTIMGVTGNYVTPTEAKAPTLAELKTAGITDHSVNIVPSSGKHLSQVTIPRITAAIDTNIISQNIKRGVSILGIDGGLDFSSWDTAHSGYFQTSTLDTYPEYIKHTTNPERLYFPLALRPDDTWMGNGDLSTSDIEYFVVDCNSCIDLPNTGTSDGCIVGVEYYRDVYQNTGSHILVFKTFYSGRYCRLYSQFAGIGLALRNITDTSGAQHNSVLNLVITAQPNQTNNMWLLLDCHNRTSQLVQCNLKFYDELLYHIDVKFTR